jgi:hypothetical protein
MRLGLANLGLDQGRAHLGAVRQQRLIFELLQPRGLCASTNTGSMRSPQASRTILAASAASAGVTRVMQSPPA